MAIPERLNDEQRVKLRAWVQENYSVLEPQIRALEEACLDHHRALPRRDRRRDRADWLACVRNWIRIHADRKGILPRKPKAPELFPLEPAGLASKEDRERIADLAHQLARKYALGPDRRGK